MHAVHAFSRNAVGHAGSRRDTAGGTGAPDFGWRLRGRVVTVLPDRSFELADAAAGVLAPYCLDPATLRSCLQCGACTAACALAGNESMFPRRQMTLVQLGLVDRLAADPEIWHCYGCGECSRQCPYGARPGSIMSAARHLAIERFAPGRPLVRAVNSPRYCWLVYAVAAGLLAAATAVFGAFTPAPGPIRYAGMLPGPVLIPLFSCVTVLALWAAAAGVGRAWRAWYADSVWRARPRALGRAARQATAEVLAHRKLADCGTRRLAAWAHRAVLFGFLGLAAVSGAIALLMPFGLAYPLAAGDPLKVAGNIFAAALTGGTCAFLIARAADRVRGQRSPFFDGAFLVNLLLVALSGDAAEVLRVAGARAAAYPVYFTHLVLVLVLIVMLPYGKLAHAAYRLVAVAGRKYAAVRAAAEVPAPVAPAPPDVAPAPETLAGLGHGALAAYPDSALSAAYYRLRDESVPHGPRGTGRYFPNIKRLFGTPFEREKDRREVRALARRADKPEVQAWYEDAAAKPCTWWLKNHLLARHALTSCMSCGMCTSVCPAAEHYEEYDPRAIVDTALSGDEQRLVSLLQSDLLWYCAQCGSCTGVCPLENDIMGLVTSLRCLAQLKGYHLRSVRGRQQYAGRHLWGGNLWNRACSVYFRNGDAAAFPDFGPRYARWQAEQEQQWERVGGQPDMDGTFPGRKVPPATLGELRNCVAAGGTLFLWDRIEEHAQAQARELGLDLDEYHDKVSEEG